MTEDTERIPTPRELKKELNDYLTKKYGDRIKLGFSPSIFPQPEGQKFDGNFVEEEKPVTSRIKFDIKPEELEAYLAEYVIKQHEAKEILATKICTHFNRINFSERYKRLPDANHVGGIKNNIIMIGPTGVGKTYLIKLIANKIGVPFVKGDATKFSETGYVGGDVEDLVRDLVQEADGDIELAQYGIIYLDEIDKIASSLNLIGPDVSRTGVQRALLKPMEETEVDLKVPHDIISQMEAVEQYRKTGRRERRKINTRNILFIMSGAFTGIEDIIRKRLHRQGLGFTADVRSKREDAALMARVKSEDLINYGFESEFVGRLPVIAVFEPLECADLYAILKNVNNPVILAKKKDFKAYGIDIRFEEPALQKIADYGFQEKTGARGLVSAIERVLIKFEKKLPSTGIKRLVVTPEMVDAPEIALEALLLNPDSNELNARFDALSQQDAAALKESIHNRDDEFSARYGDPFAEEIVDTLIAWVMEEGISVSAAFEEAARVRELVRSFEEQFLKKHGVRITFDDDALNDIIDRSFRENVDPETICQSAVNNYEFGLKLIHEKTGKSRFTIHRMALSNSEEYLNQLIRDSYEHCHPHQEHD